MGVPGILNGTGEAQKKAVIELLDSWGMLDTVCGLVFDTTASNTGFENGACALLEEHLEKGLLWLAC